MARLAKTVPLFRRLLLVVACGVSIGVTSARAKADEAPYRFGLVGVIGGGVAGVVHPGPLPSFIGFTDFGFEILGERRPWGGFLRAEFLSSGDAGRWTAFAFAPGVERRLFGDVKSTALFLRGGVSYERWTGSDAGCPIAFLVPSSCNNLNGKTSTFDVTTDTLGLLAGVRVELPVSALYLAFSANALPSVALDRSNPAGVFQLRLDFEAGFRDVRDSGQPSRTRDFDGAHPASESTTPFRK